jgi:hypothetical protein
MTGATSANRDPRSAAPTFWLVLDERPERYHPFVLSFSAKTRAANLTRMAEDRFDVLVIDGGITGVGIALDAPRAVSRWPWWRGMTSCREPPGVPRG